MKEEGGLCRITYTEILVVSPWEVLVCGQDLYIIPTLLRIVF